MAIYLSGFIEEQIFQPYSGLESQPFMRYINDCFGATSIYRKIPIISPGVYFWSKDLLAKFFFGEHIFGGT